MHSCLRFYCLQLIAKINKLIAFSVLMLIYNEYKKTDKSLKHIIRIFFHLCLILKFHAFHRLFYSCNTFCEFCRKIFSICLKYEFMDINVAKNSLKILYNKNFVIMQNICFSLLIKN